MSLCGNPYPHMDMDFHIHMWILCGSLHKNNFASPGEWSHYAPPPELFPSLGPFTAQWNWRGGVAKPLSLSSKNDACHQGKGVRHPPGRPWKPWIITMAPALFLKFSRLPWVGKFSCNIQHGTGGRRLESNLVLATFGCFFPTLGSLLARHWPLLAIVWQWYKCGGYWYGCGENHN